MRKQLELTDGRVVVVYDVGAAADAAQLTLLWHHGSPQTGAPLHPLTAAAESRGLRLLSYARPSYGGSTPLPGRDVASAADDVAQITRALGVDRFATMGASGGGPHALACAALIPDRVCAVVCFAGLAPYTDAFDWFAGMAAPAGLRSALDGRAARAQFAATDEFDEASFIPADWQALAGPWSSLASDAGQAAAAGPDGLIDDDVAFTSDWGFELAAVEAPVLVVHGGRDKVVPPSHAEWLAEHCCNSTLWLRPEEGHVSVLNAYMDAIEWVVAMGTTGLEPVTPAL